MTKVQFMNGFKDFLFEPATKEVLDKLKLHIFDYIVSNSKLEFEDFDTTKLILSLPDIEDIFNENEKFIDEIPFKKYEYNLRSFIR